MKKRVLAIGGGSVPRWAEAAFELQHVDDEEDRGKFHVEEDPDVIVVNVDFVCHQHSWQAHELGSKLKVPVLHARGGWSSAVEQAAKLRLDWFVDAVGATAKDETDEPAKLVKSAWSYAADHERQRADAALHRLAKERKARETAEATLKRVRSGARDRILVEINRRMAEIRAENDERHAALKRKVAVLTRSVLDALSTVDSVRSELTGMLGELETVAESVISGPGDSSQERDQVDSGA